MYPCARPGVALWKNSPVREKLLSLNVTTGEAHERTGVLPAIVGTDDLSVAADGVYYFLGDTASGATLVGIDIASGEAICKASVPLREIGFVGIGQTLDYDHKVKIVKLMATRYFGQALYDNVCSSFILCRTATWCCPAYQPTSLRQLGCR